MLLSLEALIMGLILNLLAFPFLLGIGAGSIQYYASISNASEESIVRLLSKFRFPLNFLDSNEREKDAIIIKNTTPAKAMKKRIIYSVLPVSWIAIQIYRVIVHPEDMATTNAAGLSLSIYITNIIGMWRLGRSLLIENKATDIH